MHAMVAASGGCTGDRRLTAASLSSHKRSSLGGEGNDLRQLAALTGSERRLMQRTWSQTTQETGTAQELVRQMFSELLLQPQIARVFDETSEDGDLAYDRQAYLGTHSARFVNVFDDLVQNLDDYDYIERQLERLCRLHRRFPGFQTSYVTNFGQAMIHCLNRHFAGLCQQLKQSRKEEEQKKREEALTKFFRLLQVGMQLADKKIQQEEEQEEYERTNNNNNNGQFENSHINQAHDAQELMNDAADNMGHDDDEYSLSLADTGYDTSSVYSDASHTTVVTVTEWPPD